MPKLEKDEVSDLKEKIRGLSRAASIQVLLGVLAVMERSVSLRAVEFPEYVEEGKKLTEIGVIGDS